MGRIDHTQGHIKTTAFESTALQSSTYHDGVSNEEAATRTRLKTEGNVDESIIADSEV